MLYVYRSYTVLTRTVYTVAFKNETKEQNRWKNRFITFLNIF